MYGSTWDNMDKSEFANRVETLKNENSIYHLSLIKELKHDIILNELVVEFEIGGAKEREGGRVSLKLNDPQLMLLFGAEGDNELNDDTDALQPGAGHGNNQMEIEMMEQMRLNKSADSDIIEEINKTNENQINCEPDHDVIDENEVYTAGGPYDNNNNGDDNDGLDSIQNNIVDVPGSLRSSTNVYSSNNDDDIKIDDEYEKEQLITPQTPSLSPMDYLKKGNDLQSPSRSSKHSKEKTMEEIDEEVINEMQDEMNNTPGNNDDQQLDDEEFIIKGNETKKI